MEMLVFKCLIIIISVWYNVNAVAVKQTTESEKSTDVTALLADSNIRSKRHPSYYNYLHYLIDKHAHSADEYLAARKLYEPPYTPYEMHIFPYGLSHPPSDIQHSPQIIPPYYNQVPIPFSGLLTGYGIHPNINHPSRLNVARPMTYLSGTQPRKPCCGGTWSRANLKPKLRYKSQERNRPTNNRNCTFSYRKTKKTKSRKQSLTVYDSQSPQQINLGQQNSPDNSTRIVVVRLGANNCTCSQYSTKSGQNVIKAKAHPSAGVSGNSSVNTWMTNGLSPSFGSSRNSKIKSNSCTGVSDFSRASVSTNSSLNSSSDPSREFEEESQHTTTVTSPISGLVDSSDSKKPNHSWATNSDLINVLETNSQHTTDGEFTRSSTVTSTTTSGLVDTTRSTENELQLTSTEQPGRSSVTTSDSINVLESNSQHTTTGEFQRSSAVTSTTTSGLVDTSRSTKNELQQTSTEQPNNSWVTNSKSINVPESNSQHTAAEEFQQSSTVTSTTSDLIDSTNSSQSKENKTQLASTEQPDQSWVTTSDSINLSNSNTQHTTTEEFQRSSTVTSTTSGLINSSESITEDPVGFWLATSTTSGLINSSKSSADSKVKSLHGGVAAASSTTFDSIRSSGIGKNSQVESKHRTTEVISHISTIMSTSSDLAVDSNSAAIPDPTSNTTTTTFIPTHPWVSTTASLPSTESPAFQATNAAVDSTVDSGSTFSPFRIKFFSVETSGDSVSKEFMPALDHSDNFDVTTKYPLVIATNPVSDSFEGLDFTTTPTARSDSPSILATTSDSKLDTTANPRLFSGMKRKTVVNSRSSIISNLTVAKANIASTSSQHFNSTSIDISVTPTAIDSTLTTQPISISTTSPTLRDNAKFSSTFFIGSMLSSTSNTHPGMISTTPSTLTETPRSTLLSNIDSPSAIDPRSIFKTPPASTDNPTSASMSFDDSTPSLIVTTDSTSISTVPYASTDNPRSAATLFAGSTSSNDMTFTSPAISTSSSDSMLHFVSDSATSIFPSSVTDDVSTINSTPVSVSIPASLDLFTTNSISDENSHATTTPVPILTSKSTLIFVATNEPSTHLAEVTSSSSASDTDVTSVTNLQSASGSESTSILNSSKGSSFNSDHILKSTGELKSISTSDLSSHFNSSQSSNLSHQSQNIGTQLPSPSASTSSKPRKSSIHSDFDPNPIPMDDFQSSFVLSTAVDPMAATKQPNIETKNLDLMEFLGNLERIKALKANNSKHSKTSFLVESRNQSIISEEESHVISTNFHTATTNHAMENEPKSDINFMDSNEEEEFTEDHTVPIDETTRHEHETNSNSKSHKTQHLMNSNEEEFTEDHTVPIARLSTHSHKINSNSKDIKHSNHKFHQKEEIQTWDNSKHLDETFFDDISEAEILRENPVSKEDDDDDDDDGSPSFFWRDNPIQHSVEDIHIIPIKANGKFQTLHFGSGSTRFIEDTEENVQDTLELETGNSMGRPNDMTGTGSRFVNILRKPNDRASFSSYEATFAEPLVSGIYTAQRNEFKYRSRSPPSIYWHRIESKSQTTDRHLKELRPFESADFEDIHLSEDCMDSTELDKDAGGTKIKPDFPELFNCYANLT